MPLTLAALKTELQTDPTALGYAAHVTSGTTWQLAMLLNAPRAGISVTRTLLKTWEVVAATVVSEYLTLTADQKDFYRIIISAGDVDVGDVPMRALLGALFPAGSATRTNLTARVSRQGSRAEQLFGVSVSTDDCAAALRS